MNDRVGAIEKFFLDDGKWELEIIPEGLPNAIPGRWLWLSDANYGFRPVDLLEALDSKTKSPTNEATS
jgi:hypothetical protein